MDQVIFWVAVAVLVAVSWWVLRTLPHLLAGVLTTIGNNAGLMVVLVVAVLWSMGVFDRFAVVGERLETLKASMGPNN